MATKNRLNLKVQIIDPDFYAIRALNSYIAWDRRTRVVSMATSLKDALNFLNTVAEPEYPDVVLIDPSVAESPEELKAVIGKLRQIVPKVMVLVLARQVMPAFVQAAIEADARGYLLRNEVGINIVSAIAYAIDHELTITRGVKKSMTIANTNAYIPRMGKAKTLPKQRTYPEMTERIRQALWLCVIEGMSAQLAADEMGVSPHTIRSYIKEGYRILKAHDNTVYPKEMSPEEQAFMRFTALEDDADAES